MKVLHLKQERPSYPLELCDEISKTNGVEVDIVDNWASLSEGELISLIQGYDILLASRTPYIPDQLAEAPGKLKYICYIHGTMNTVIGLPIIRSDIQVTNWGNRAGRILGQDSLTLLLTVFRDLQKRMLAVRRGAGGNIKSVGYHLSQLNIGVYGFGFSAQEFVRLVQPFGATIRIYDPYISSVPDFCMQVDSLESLFSSSQAIIIHAGLTAETEKSVTKDLLAMLPDDGIIINTARGAIIDQDALFAELKSGRLRAAVDVLWPDDLPPEHEAREWENFIWTCHQFDGVHWPSEGREGMMRPYRSLLCNIKAFTEGKSLDYLIDETRYLRMT